MRKVSLFRSGEKVIEFDVSDNITRSGLEVKSMLGLDEVKTLLGLSQTPIEQTKPEEAMIDRFDKTLYEQKQEIIQQVRQQKLQSSQILLSPDKWQLILESDAEIRGRSDQSKYYLYRSRINNVLVGRIISKSHRLAVRLGNPNDTSSPISQIMKAVNAMSFYETFTRRTISESLPSNLARGHILKFALEYMGYMGLVAKQKERDIRGGAIVYKRKGDSSSNKVGSNAAEAIQP